MQRNGPKKQFAKLNASICDLEQKTSESIIGGVCHLEN